MENKENLEKLLEQVRSEIAGKLLEENQKPLEIQLKNYDTRDKNRFNKTVGGYLDKILQNYDSLETYYALKFREWLSTMDIARKYFDFSDKKQLRHQPDEYRYYCFTCDRKLTRKQTRRHKLRNHLVIRLSEPKPKIIQDSEKFSKSIETKSFLEPFSIPKCWYCGKQERDDFPLTRKVVYYVSSDEDDKIGKPFEVTICAKCYYERFGKRSLAGNSKNPIVKEKISKFLWIQRNYVINLKNIKPEELAEITNRIRINIKYQIEQKLLSKGIREPEYSRLLEKELRGKLSRVVILC